MPRASAIFLLWQKHQSWRHAEVIDLAWYSPNTNLGGRKKATRWSFSFGSGKNIFPAIFSGQLGGITFFNSNKWTRRPPEMDGTLNFLWELWKFPEIRDAHGLPLKLLAKDNILSLVHPTKFRSTIYIGGRQAMKALCMQIRTTGICIIMCSLMFRRHQAVKPWP